MLQLRKTTACSGAGPGSGPSLELPEQPETVGPRVEDVRGRGQGRQVPVHVADFPFGGYSGQPRDVGGVSGMLGRRQDLAVAVGQHREPAEQRRGLTAMISPGCCRPGLQPRRFAAGVSKGRLRNRPQDALGFSAEDMPGWWTCAQDRFLRKSAPDRNMCSRRYVVRPLGRWACERTNGLKGLSGYSIY